MRKEKKLTNLSPCFLLWRKVKVRAFTDFYFTIIQIWEKISRSWLRKPNSDFTYPTKHWIRPGFPHPYMFSLLILFLLLKFSLICLSRWGICLIAAVTVHRTGENWHSRLKPCLQLLLLSDLSYESILQKSIILQSNASIMEAKQKFRVERCLLIWGKVGY